MDDLSRPYSFSDDISGDCSSEVLHAVVRQFKLLRLCVVVTVEMQIA